MVARARVGLHQSGPGIRQRIIEASEQLLVALSKTLGFTHVPVDDFPRRETMDAFQINTAPMIETIAQVFVGRSNLNLGRLRRWVDRFGRSRAFSRGGKHKARIAARGIRGSRSRAAGCTSE